jgi:uncharacterized protein
LQVASPSASRSCRWGTGPSQGRTLTKRSVRLAVASAALLGACSQAPNVVKVTPVGFPSTSVRVRDSNGAERTLCMLLAETEADRARGLMDVSSVGDNSGMVFRFGGETTARFYMYRTKIPLDIAFLGGDGHVVSVASMDPCLAADASICPLYGASAPYVDAIEVPTGALGRLGIASGSTVAVTNTPC